MHPLEPDEMWCVWSCPESGTYEWICGSERARDLLTGGMTKINGKPVRVEIVGEWPQINGVQIRATGERNAF